MIEIKNLTLYRGHKPLLHQANLMISPGNRVGIIGRNGTGKSSLFSVIQGGLSYDQGEVLIPKHWTIAAVAQETPALTISALDYVLQGDTRLQLIQAALIQAQKNNDGMAIAECHSQLEEIDAYSANARASKLLCGLGFSEEEQHQQVVSFSGGWRMRLNLAQALMCRADLLLLDEPTNHLDLETVLWLEEYLTSLSTTQLIISHDIDFLNATTTQTVEIRGQKLNFYGGNYDFFCHERAIRLQQQQSAFVKQQNRIQHLQSFINRFKAKATKATQAQSRIKALEKLEKISPAYVDNELSFSFQNPDDLPNPLLKMSNVYLGYDDKTVLEKIDLSIESGARYGLLGVNGSGKSTLIKAISGSLKPISGEIITSDKLKIGYFAQHQLDILRADQNPIWHIQQLNPEIPDLEIRRFLGGFDFSGDRALQNIESFSGGEKARLVLALIIWQKPNLLLLDEPTNHLDLEMRYALTTALQGFCGAVLLVSHDRALLEATTDQFLVVQHKGIQAFPGDLNDYQRFRLQYIEEQSSASDVANDDCRVVVSRKEQKRLAAQQRQERSRLTKPVLDNIQQTEQIMAKLQREISEYETFLATEEAYFAENKNTLQLTLTQLAKAKSALQEQELNWLQAQEQLEEIEQQLNQLSI